MDLFPDTTTKVDVHCVFQSYQSFPLSDPKFFDLITNDKAPVWRKMVFGLTYFHAAVQERIKYGPLGWNIPYQFSDPDLKISLRQLQSFLLEFPDSIPFKVSNYVSLHHMVQTTFKQKNTFFDMSTFFQFLGFILSSSAFRERFTPLRYSTSIAIAPPGKLTFSRTA